MSAEHEFDYQNVREVLLNQWKVERSEPAVRGILRNLAKLHNIDDATDCIRSWLLDPPRRGVFTKWVEQLRRRCYELEVELKSADIASEETDGRYCVDDSVPIDDDRVLLAMAYGLMMHGLTDTARIILAQDNSALEAEQDER